MLAIAKRIDESITTVTTLEKHESRLSRIEQDIGGVRKLIGVTKEFQDFRILTTDVEELKKTHVNREIFDTKINELKTRIDLFREFKEAYDEVLDQQNNFMKQQSEVMKQQSSFMNWIKYSTVLIPITVACIPIIEIVIRYFLGTP